MAGWYFGDLDPIVFSTESAILAIGVLVVTMLSLVTVSTPGRTDSGRSDISVARIRLARVAAGVVCLSAVLLGGRDALVQVGPVASVIAATALVGLVTLASTRAGVSDRVDGADVDDPIGDDEGAAG